MALTHEDVLMASGNWDVDLDWSPEVYDKLTFLHEGKRRPRRDLHALIKRKSDNALMAPPLPLFRVGGGKEGLLIGGRGPLWHLGADIGPLIRDWEPISGKNKLSNGNFALLGDFWQRPSEGSLWTFSAGSSMCVGGLAGDDVLASDEKFPTRPGYQYRAEASSVGDRVRILFEGEFNPPNILPDAGFGGGGWSTTPNISVVDGVMRIGAIPKPELMAPDFSSGWTPGSTMSISGGRLLCGEIPKPQYLTSAEASFTPSPFVTYHTDAAHSFTGTSPYRKVGPLPQHEIQINGSFEDDLYAWVQVAGTWGISTATHVAGTKSATSAGPGPNMRSLQADYNPATPDVDWFPLLAGDEWRVEVYLRGGDKGTSDAPDGEIRFLVYLVDQAYPLYDSWLDVATVYGTDRNSDAWKFGQVTVTAPPDKVGFVPMATIWGQTAGSWYVDAMRIIKTRGNSTGIWSGRKAAIPNQRYRFWAMVNSDPRIDGSVALHLLFHGPGKPFVETVQSQSQTYGKWTLVSVEGTCPKGYDQVEGMIEGIDVLPGAFYVDAEYTRLEKADNNTDRATYAPIPVTPAQHYLLGATVEPLAFIEDGSVTVGVTLSGPGLDDEIISTTHSFAQDEIKPERIFVDVTPKPGYTQAAPFVLNKDLAGGEGGPIVAVSKPALTKMDNNTETSTGTIFSVTPERTYHWQETATPSAQLQRGTITLSARCIRAGYPDVTFDSSPKEGSDEGGKRMTFDFTPPSGYDQVEPRIIATDVEGPDAVLWTIDDGDLRDTDKSTVVFDSVPGSALVDATAPAGAQFVRVLLVVEQGSSWAVSSVSLARIVVTPATGNAILAQLLTDPTTGAPLSIAPGVLSCPEVIPYDWQLLNMTARDALEHYCGVVSEPPREFHITPTLPPALNVGTAETVFTDHGPDSPFPITLLERDRDVEDIGDVELDAEDRPTEIEVIGAVRKTVSGQDILITATAQVPGPVEYDLNNRPISRTKIVSDGTVDHFGYAQALAADLATKEAQPPLSVTVKLSGHERECPPGDWIYAYDPQAGLEDAGNGHSIEGEWVSPRRERVLSNTRHFGSAYKVVMREPDGTEWDLPGVHPSDEDSTTLVIGDRLAPWEADPQGGSEGQQYLRDRKSGPR